MTYKELLAEMRLGDDGDPWGNCMYWWFTVADEMHFNRHGAPDDWQFRPSPLGPTNDEDDYCTRAVREVDDDALYRFGAVLHRYASKLKAAGRDY